MVVDSAGVIATELTSTERLETLVASKKGVLWKTLVIASAFWISDEWVDAKVAALRR